MPSDQIDMVKEIPNKIKNLIVIASVFENDFSVDWLFALNVLKPSQLFSELEEAVTLGILINKGHGIYIFADPKKKSTYQDCLTPEQKDQLHRQISDFFINELPDTEEKILTLSYHLFFSQNDVERSRWLMKAGDLYQKSFHIEKALQCFSKIIADLAAFSGKEVDSLFTDVVIKYSKISTARENTTRVLSILNEAISRAKRWNNQAHLALLDMHLAKNEWLCSRYDSALSHFERGWAKAKKVNDPKLLRSATTFSTFFLYWQGRIQEAVQTYEKAISEIEKYPKGTYPLLAAMVVGYCYGLIGQRTQGLGMLDAIYQHCLGKGDRFLATWGRFNIGALLLDIRRTDDALQYLKSAVEDADREHNDLVAIMGRLMLSFAHYLKEEKEISISYLHEFLQLSKNVHVEVRPYPYLLELCWAMHQGKLPQLSEISLETEILHALASKNILMKGVAYRYQALIQRENGLDSTIIINSLRLSIRSLEESGHQIELAKSQSEMARELLLIGKDDEARKIALAISKTFPSTEALIPDDIRSLITDPSRSENLLKEITILGQEIATIRDTKDLVQHIISTVNKVTGAERGAIFFIESEKHPFKVQLRASKNLTLEQITDPNFHSSMQTIEKVAQTGKGLIWGTVPESDHPNSGTEIRSCICVPMILRDKIIGVLYHDNRILSSAFKESDLEILSYFAAFAALALDNVKAYEEIQESNKKLNQEKLYYEEMHLQSLRFNEIVGASPAIMHVFDQIDQVAKTDTTVLILGETGVGKELVARAIHLQSSRQEKPFIHVLCNALPDSLIHSELFGHEKGAFTGAIQRRIGRFELAHEGTLFLDEIGDLPLDVQVRLLRVLQNKEFERVGGSDIIHSDFRLILATNRNLETEVTASKFRADLFYRINVFPILVPPLRERREDIPLLAHYFLKTHSTKMSKSFSTFPDSEMEKLINYDWPGNVRELENLIERGVILGNGPVFKIPEIAVMTRDVSALSPDPTLSGNERRHIIWALQRTNWKIRGSGGAAELLSLNPSTLAFRMKKLGIEKPQGIKIPRSSHI
jgi:transcriptional regulator with GAF, ATPase, and Fis domain/tetratricopeptide (TPR) repeat protein